MSDKPKTVTKSGTENVGHLCPQGNVASRKLNDPSGYVLFAGSGTKTFRTVEAALAFADKKGIRIATQPKKA